MYWIMLSLGIQGARITASLPYHVSSKAMLTSQYHRALRHAHHCGIEAPARELILSFVRGWDDDAEDGKMGATVAMSQWAAIGAEARQIFSNPATW